MGRWLCSDAFLVILRRTAVIAVIAIVVVATAASALLAVCGGVFNLAGAIPDERSGVMDAVMTILIFTLSALVAGGVPLLCWGVPAYAVTAHRNRQSWIAAVAIGATPALIYAVCAPEQYYVAALYLAYGTATALLTHHLYTRYPALGAPRPHHLSLGLGKR